jgi:serine/threonine-protein kinase HipA
LPRLHGEKMDSDELAALRTVNKADVYKAGFLAATLERTPDGITFQYLQTWLESDGPAVASTLPLTSSPVQRAGGALPAYFSGLLPEGRRLGALRREIKTSADDELSLLLGVGGDVVGDVQIVPTGSSIEEIRPRVQVTNFSEISFVQLLKEQGLKTERIGFAGFQDKVSAAVLNVPVAQRGERYILKLNPPEYPHVVENEAFFLQAAKLSGLNVAKARVVTDVDGERGLLVTRFDRIPTKDKPTIAVAVEDASQILGRPPADKYLISTEEAFKALSELCLAPLPAARNFVGQLAFAYLTGNGDAHAKNFSVLRPPDGEWLPSPAYDLPSTYFYDDDSMAMSLHRRTRDFGGKDFVFLGEYLGLPERAVRRIITNINDRVGLWLPDIQKLPFTDTIKAKFIRHVNYRQMRLSQ